MGEHGWFDKRWIYSEVLHMPFIVFKAQRKGGKSERCLSAIPVQFGRNQKIARTVWFNIANASH